MELPTFFDRLEAEIKAISRSLDLLTDAMVAILDEDMRRHKTVLALQNDQDARHVIFGNHSHEKPLGVITCNQIQK